MKKLKNHTVTVRARREVVYREFAYFPGECFNVAPTDAVALSRAGYVSLTLPMDPPTVRTKIVTPETPTPSVWAYVEGVHSGEPVSDAEVTPEPPKTDPDPEPEPEQPRRRRRTYQRKDEVADEPVGK